jgi:EAL domain-containing protein (putative c-di-GMP-specific phosphodiesterase class I)
VFAVIESDIFTAHESLHDTDDTASMGQQLHEIITMTGPTLVVEPIAHIQTRNRVGGEALARFPGAASTREWFELADQLGMRNDLELRILGDVIEQTPFARGFLSVNISTDALLDPRCLPLLQSVDGAELVVELTDTDSLSRTAELQRQLAAVRELGIRIAVHVSTLDAETNRLVAQLEPDLVKLDPSLSAALARGEIDTAAAQSFKTYCRRYGVFVVAVGVRSEAELVTLHGAGADAMQGRHLRL